MRSLTGATSRKPYANSVKRRSGGRKSLGSAKKRKCATGMTLAKALLGIPASTECTPAAPGRGRSDSAIIGHRAPVMSFQLWSNSFAQAGWIPELHSCKGADLSPSLEWSGEPGDVRSFALVVEDPDPPSGTFCHWLVYDIPPDVHNLAQLSASPRSAAGAGSSSLSKSSSSPSGISPTNQILSSSAGLYGIFEKWTPSRSHVFSETVPSRSSSSRAR